MSGGSEWSQKVLDEILLFVTASNREPCVADVSRVLEEMSAILQDFGAVPGNNAPRGSREDGVYR